MIDLTLDPSLAGSVRLGLVAVQGIRSEPAGEALRSEVARLAERIRKEHAGLPPSEIPGLAPARELYRSFGVDPTRTRPSSEALLRRILQGKPFPEISGPVDLCNFLAVRFLLPIGLYDTARLSGPVVLRRGGAGEGYEGIRKDRVNLEGRPALCDAVGPFGNPTSDSARSCVTPATTALLFVLFTPAGYPVTRLREQLTTAAEAIGTLLPRTEPGGSPLQAVETALLPVPAAGT